MSNDNPTVSPKSPDYLAAPKRGKDVRRLNRVPQFVVGGLLALVVIGISYTFFERQNTGSRKVTETGTQPPVSTTNTPPISPDNLAPPEPPSTTIDPVYFNQPSENVAAPTRTTPVVTSEMLQNRLRIIQRVEERKMAQWEAALGAEGTVQSFSMIKTNSGSESKSTDLTDPYGFLREAAAMAAADGMPGSADDMIGFGSGGMGGGQTSMTAENRQREKRAFLSGTPEEDIYLQRQRVPAISASQEVKAGTIIPGVLISGLNSDLPGQLIAQVKENVYDSATGQSLLIPSGARLVGMYDSDVTLGQKRALVGWQRIIYPDGSSISLEMMPGADVSGYAGFNDKVNNHYGRIFGNALLLSIFSSAIQLSQPQTNSDGNYSSQAIIAGSLGQQMGQLGMQMAQRNMNIQPTLEIRPGYQFNVMVTKDIILPSWVGHPLAH